MKRAMGLILMMLMLASPALANDDPTIQFMRNNFDVIAIGEVTAVSDETCTIRVDSTVVSVRGKRKQLKPDEIEMVRDPEDFEYVGFHDATAQVGDFVLVAAFRLKKGDKFDGSKFRVDSLDKQTLRIQTRDDASSGFQCQCKMIEDFIHSDGQNTEFRFERTEDMEFERVYRYPTKERRPEDAELIFEIGADHPALP